MQIHTFVFVLVKATVDWTFPGLEIYLMRSELIAKDSLQKK